MTPRFNNKGLSIASLVSIVVARRSSVELTVVIALATVLTSCARPEGPRPRPEQVTDFRELFDMNCAGCHGSDGRHGVAQSLNDPLYLALIGDARLRDVISHGVPGTPMSAFATDAGGALAAEQIDALVDGMKRQWGSAEQSASVSLPAYSENGAMAQGLSRGDARRGLAAYSTYCSRCHGGDGRGGPSAGSVVDQDFLSLTSDQALRTTVIAGRADEGLPGWREYVPGEPMKPQEISDVVAWLSAHRGNHE